MIIDNYKFKYELQRKIKKYVTKLIVIDDYLDKKYFCDISRGVLDPLSNIGIFSQFEKHDSIVEINIDSSGNRQTF